MDYAILICLLHTYIMPVTCKFRYQISSLRIAVSRLCGYGYLGTTRLIRSPYRSHAWLPTPGGDD